MSDRADEIAALAYAGSHTQESVARHIRAYAAEALAEAIPKHVTASVRSEQAKQTRAVDAAVKAETDRCVSLAKDWTGGAQENLDLLELAIRARSTATRGIPRIDRSEPGVRVNVPVAFLAMRKTADTDLRARAASGNAECRCPPQLTGHLHDCPEYGAKPAAASEAECSLKALLVGGWCVDDACPLHGRR